MCRLLLVINESLMNIDSQLLNNFFSQTNNKKNTPGLSNRLDADYHQDGYGITYIKNDNWILNKSGYTYDKDNNFNSFVTEMINYNPNVIIGHIRNKGSNSIGLASYDNSHPFIYKNYAFAHNGFIKNFSDHKSIIYDYINIKYRNYIYGETDSEHIFYLLLTIVDLLQNEYIEDGYKLHELYIMAFEKLFSLLIQFKIELVGNFIFCDSKVVISIRYISKIFNSDTLFSSIKNITYDRIFDPPSLYIFEDKLNNKIIISSEPVTESFNIIDKNSFWHHYIN